MQCKYPHCGKQCQVDYKCDNGGVCITESIKSLSRNNETVYISSSENYTFHNSVNKTKHFKKLRNLSEGRSIFISGDVVIKNQEVGCDCPMHYCGRKCETFCANGGTCIGMC